MMRKRLAYIPLLILCLAGFTVSALSADLMVGVSQKDITPPGKVPLQGQFNLRISEAVDSPLTANALALESVENGKSLECVIFVSADIIGISDDLLSAVREKVAVADSSIDVTKLVLNGTHTHTAPTLDLDAPKLPEIEGLMDYPKILDHVAGGITEAIVEAWKNRKPGKFAWGFDHAVIGFTRRAVYADGRSVMYGNPGEPGFTGYENMEDHDVGTLFFLDENDKLLSVVVNVACPSQEVEGLSRINADFWHDVRLTLNDRFGDDVVVLGWCSAAGDVSPHIQYRKAAHKRMLAKRGVNEMQEIARKIDRAVADVWDVVSDEKIANPVLKHRVETLKLPMRLVTRQEYESALAEVKQIEEQRKANAGKTEAEVGWMAAGWHGQVVERYLQQQAGKAKEFETTIHVIRLGDAAICTNQFELFTDYGVQMKTKSPAMLTFVIQLAGSGGYLPTKRAVEGGGYSAVIQSSTAGPEGGQVLVDKTVELMRELWK